MVNFPMKCPSCMESYSDTKLPRNLLCGHSVCTTCTKQEHMKRKSCPECREKYSVDDYFTPPVNYPLARMMRSHAEGKFKVTMKSTKDPLMPMNVQCDQGDKSVKCPGHGGPIAFLCFSCSAGICQDCMVVDHCSPPRGTCMILSTSESLQYVEADHQRRSEKLLGEVKSLKRKLTSEVERHDICLKYCRRDTRSHKTFVSDIDKDLEYLKKKSESMFKLSVNKIGQMKTTKMTSVVEITEAGKALLDYQENVTKYAQQQEKKIDPLHKNILKHFRMDLKTMMESTKEPFYTFLVVEGITKWALVTPKNKGLLLYSLKFQKPPLNKTVLPYDFVRDLLPEKEPTMFFEVEWENKLRGFVYISLFTDLQLGRQTLPLFSGERGPTFKNTCFHKLDDDEILHGGDFVNNDGTGRAPRDDGMVRRFIKYLTTNGVLAVDRLNKSKFYIQLKPQTYNLSVPVGRVIQGLRYLKTASKVNPITNSGIRDCGLFIPLRKSNMY